eukprot:352766-Chlamydomonas_euryale.AAC.6
MLGVRLPLLLPPAPSPRAFSSAVQSHAQAPHNALRRHGTAPRCGPPERARPRRKPQTPHLLQHAPCSDLPWRIRPRAHPCSHEPSRTLPAGSQCLIRHLKSVHARRPAPPRSRARRSWHAAGFGDGGGERAGCRGRRQHGGCPVGRAFTALRSVLLQGGLVLV